MKRIFHLLAFLCAPGLLCAQITITSADMPAQGDSVYVTNSSLLNISYPWDSSGAGISWNLFTLTPISQTTQLFEPSLQVSPVYSAAFGLSSIGLKTQDSTVLQGVSLTDVYAFFDNNANRWAAEGTGLRYQGIPIPSTYDDPDEIYQFPLNFGDVDTSTFSVETNISATINYKRSGIRINHVDAWGALVTPYDTFNTIRVVSTVIQEDSVAVNGNVQIINTTRRQYRWLSNGGKVPVLEIKGNVNFAGNFTITAIQYLDESLDGQFCLAPENPRTTVVTKNSARLEWDFVPNASGYQIRGKPAASANWTFLQIPDPSITHKDVFGLSQGVLYQWNVLSICDSALTSSSEWSNHRTFTPDCYAPTSTETVLTTSNGARLSWRKVNGVAGYEIKGQRIGATGIATIQVSHADTVKDVFGLLPGSQYWWTIRSICNQTGTNLSGFAENDTFRTMASNRIGQLNVREFAGAALNKSHWFVTSFDKQVSFHFSNLEQEALFQIRNVNGALIDEKRVTEDETLVTFGDLEMGRGIYLATLKTASWVETKKFILE